MGVHTGVLCAALGVFGRKLRFSIRALIVATAAIGAVAGYLGCETRAVRLRGSMLDEILSHGGFYSWQVGGGANRWWHSEYAGTLADFETLLHKRDLARQPSALRLWLGDKDVEQILIPKDYGARDAHEIARCFPEALVVFEK